MPASRHVQPDPAGGRNVRKRGASRVTSHHDRQAEAVARAREILRKGGGRLLVHGRNGRIRAKDTIMQANDRTRRRG
jgi:hypothetical protein